MIPATRSSPGTGSLAERRRHGRRLAARRSADPAACDLFAVSLCSRRCSSRQGLVSGAIELSRKIAAKHSSRVSALPGWPDHIAGAGAVPRPLRGRAGVLRHDHDRLRRPRRTSVSWHYAAGGEQRGPVDDAAFDRLVASGEVTPDTLVWRAGMPGWQPLREARAGVSPAHALVERRPGTGPTPEPQPTIDPEAAFARIVAEGRRVRVVDSLRRGWDLVFALPGESIGVSALVILTILGSGLLPCVGSIAQVIATGPLVGGWYLYFLKRMRGQPTEWGDAWAGFSSPMVAQLILQYVVAFVASMVAMIPVVAAVFVVLFGSIAAAAAASACPLASRAGCLASSHVGCYLTIAGLRCAESRQHLPFWPRELEGVPRQFLPLLGCPAVWASSTSRLPRVCVGCSAPCRCASPRGHSLLGSLRRRPAGVTRMARGWESSRSRSAGRRRAGALRSAEPHPGHPRPAQSAKRWACRAPSRATRRQRQSSPPGELEEISRTWLAFARSISASRACSCLEFPLLTTNAQALPFPLPTVWLSSPGLGGWELEVPWKLEVGDWQFRRRQFAEPPAGAGTSRAIRSGWLNAM